MNKEESARLDEIVAHLSDRNSGKETVENIHKIRLSEIVWYLKILQRKRDRESEE